MYDWVDTLKVADAPVNREGPGAWPSRDSSTQKLCYGQLALLDLEWPRIGLGHPPQVWQVRDVTLVVEIRRIRGKKYILRTCWTEYGRSTCLSNKSPGCSSAFAAQVFIIYQLAADFAPIDFDGR
jgi:hypothetical protein